MSEPNNAFTLDPGKGERAGSLRLDHGDEGAVLFFLFWEVQDGRCAATDLPLELPANHATSAVYEHSHDRANVRISRTKWAKGQYAKGGVFPAGGLVCDGVNPFLSAFSKDQLKQGAPELKLVPFRYYRSIPKRHARVLSIVLERVTCEGYERWYRGQQLYRNNKARQSIGTWRAARRTLAKDYLSLFTLAETYDESKDGDRAAAQAEGRAFVKRHGAVMIANRRRRGKQWMPTSALDLAKFNSYDFALRCLADPDANSCELVRSQARKLVEQSERIRADKFILELSCADRAYRSKLITRLKRIVDGGP